MKKLGHSLSAIVLIILIAMVMHIKTGKNGEQYEGIYCRI